MGLRLMPTSILLLAAGVHALAQVEVRPRELMQLAANWHGESLEDDWEQVIVLRAGVPLGHVQALNAAGTEIDYAEFVALSGWGFSFAYKYGDVSPGFIAVRGNPDGEEPISAFGWLTTRLGYTFDSAPTKQPENLWPFVKRHIDAGTPILTEHHDGGLITGYRERDGKREVWFAGSAFQDWVAIEKLDPFEVCVLVDDRDPMPREELVHEALERAVRFAGPSRANDVAMGLAAVEAFVEDMADPAKSFDDCQDWFGWASLERLTARKACAIWLTSLAEELPLAEQPLKAAASHYRRAAYLYHSWRYGVLGLRDADDPRARAPGKVAALAPLLREALAAEMEAIGELEDAVAALR